MQMAWHIVVEFSLEGLSSGALGMIEQCWEQGLPTMEQWTPISSTIFSVGLALIRQGKNVILKLLGDGLHDGMAEAGGVLCLNFKLN